MNSALRMINKYKWIIAIILIIGFSVVRLCFKIWIDTFSFLDEYITFDAATGFLYTGEFKLWDFHHGVITDRVYTRAWPHSVLLSLWFRAFGVDVVAGKVLSCIFGLITIASLIYITYKIYDNPLISFLSCFIFLSNKDVVLTFRMIRMYALWLPLMIWVFYYVYLALVRYPKGRGGSGSFSEKNPKDSGTCSSFSEKDPVKKDFDISIIGFSLKYIIIALFWLFIAYSTHVNTLAAGAGFALFFLFLMLTKREKRYFIALGLMVALLLLVCLIPIGPLAPLRGVLNEGIKALGILEDPNIQYARWLADYTESRGFFFITMAGALIYLIRRIMGANKHSTVKPLKKEDETGSFDIKGGASEIKNDESAIKDNASDTKSDVLAEAGVSSGKIWGDIINFTIYSFLIVISSVVAFVYFLNRYYQSRYMIYVAPLTALLMAIGVCEWADLIWKGICRLRKGAETGFLKWGIMAVTILFFLLIPVNTMRQEYYDIYSSIEIPRHINVYEKIKSDAGYELSSAIIPIIGFDIRDNYAVRIFDDYVTREFDRKNDMEAFMDFAEMYPDGYMSVETSKINGFSEGIKPFIFEYSERLTGRDIDTNAIETVRYHVLKKNTVISGKPMQDKLIEYEAAPGNNGTDISISINTGKLEGDRNILFLVFDTELPDGERENRCCQLVVNKAVEKEECFMYDFNIPRACKNVELKDYLVFGL